VPVDFARNLAVAGHQGPGAGLGAAEVEAQKSSLCSTSSSFLYASVATDWIELAAVVLEVRLEVEIAVAMDSGPEAVEKARDD
jgi:hypothetical protein